MVAKGTFGRIPQRPVSSKPNWPVSLLFLSPQNAVEAQWQWGRCGHVSRKATATAAQPCRHSQWNSKTFNASSLAQLEKDCEKRAGKRAEKWTGEKEKVRVICSQMCQINQDGGTKVRQASDDTEQGELRLANSLHVLTQIWVLQCVQGSQNRSRPIRNV